MLVSKDLGWHGSLYPIRDVCESGIFQIRFKVLSIEAIPVSNYLQILLHNTNTLLETAFRKTVVFTRLRNLPKSVQKYIFRFFLRLLSRLLKRLMKLACGLLTVFPIRLYREIIHFFYIYFGIFVVFKPVWTHLCPSTDVTPRKHTASCQPFATVPLR